MSLVFYEKAHRYKLDGRWVPGVTTLIKGGLPAPALMYWSARSVAEWVADNPDDVEQLRRMGRGPMVQALKEVPWQKRDDAGDRGSEIHAIGQKLVHGDEVEVPETIDGYVQACLDFLDTYRIEPLVVERPLGHRAHWWAGTGDLFGRLPDHRIILVDYKSSRSGIFAEAAYQLSAYSHAEFYVDEDGNEHPIPKVDECWAVHLRENDYDVIPLKADDDVYKEFRHIAYVAAAAKRAKGDKTNPGYVGQPLDPPTLEKTA